MAGILCALRCRESVGDGRASSAKTAMSPQRILERLSWQGTVMHFATANLPEDFVAPCRLGDGCEGDGDGGRGFRLTIARNETMGLVKPHIERSMRTTYRGLPSSARLRTRKSCCATAGVCERHLGGYEANI